MNVYVEAFDVLVWTRAMRKSIYTFFDVPDPRVGRESREHGELGLKAQTV